MSESRTPGYPYGEFDAMKWADEFERLSPGRMDHGTMLGWFANAIMTGYDRARSEWAATLPATSGTTTDCPLEGVHEHAFRGPHRFHEWDPADYVARRGEKVSA